MHDALFEAQNEWAGAQSAGESFKAMAGELGLDQAQFDACLDGGKYADKIQADVQQGSTAGVSGTPAFRVNGTELSGAQPFAAFQKQIEYFLAGGEPPSLEVPADSYRSLGEADAPVVVTEFSDYQCPACAQAESMLVPELIERYVDTGRARFVYRQYPLTQIHPYAPQAAQAAVCAGEQGNYWEMHEKLFAEQADWSAETAVPLQTFQEYADEIGLDAGAFEECLTSQESALAVQADVMAGDMLGVNATPTFLVNDLPIRGGLSIDQMGQVIEYMAAGQPAPAVVPTDGNWRALGNLESARAAMLAFVDYGSPESARHALDVLPALREQYVDAGTLIYVLHPWVQSSDAPATRAAVAAECAAGQDKGWEMHDLLFEKQQEWLAAGELEATLGGYAGSLDLDENLFAECMASKDTLAQVQAGTVVGVMIGVPETPIYVFSNGQSLPGDSAVEDFQTMLDSIIGE